MDKKVEDIMSDLSSDDDAKERKKEGTGKAQGRIKNSKFFISFCLSHFFFSVMSLHKMGMIYWLVRWE